MRFSATYDIVHLNEVLDFYAFRGFFQFNLCLHLCVSRFLPLYLNASELFPDVLVEIENFLLDLTLSLT